MVCPENQRKGQWRQHTFSLAGIGELFGVQHWGGNLALHPHLTWLRLHFCAPITPSSLPLTLLCSHCLLTHLLLILDHGQFRFRGHVLTLPPAPHSGCGKQKRRNKGLLSRLHSFPATRAVCSSSTIRVLVTFRMILTVATLCCFRYPFVSTAGVGREGYKRWNARAEVGLLVAVLPPSPGTSFAIHTTEMLSPTSPVQGEEWMRSCCRLPCPLQPREWERFPSLSSTSKRGTLPEKVFPYLAPSTCSPYLVQPACSTNGRRYSGCSQTGGGSQAVADCLA